tara:strand:- start:11 stop:151 length:141 start_codon:yes stop_codon:yes gene_type:complete
MPVKPKSKGKGKGTKKEGDPKKRQENDAAAIQAKVAAKAAAKVDNN